MDPVIVLFGEAEKGDFQKAYYCSTLWELSHNLGEPPSQECLGLNCAIQSILFQRKVIYFRVHEEGFSTQDYLRGLNFLEEKKDNVQVTAIALPGVGSREIIDVSHAVCTVHRSFLIITARDLYDYLTSFSTEIK